MRHTSESDIPIVPLVRLGLVALVALVGGFVMLIRACVQSPVPPIESLQKITGVVQMETEYYRTRRSSRVYPVLVLNRERFEYLSWFPQADELPQLVESGETITIWTDAYKNNWVWQIERDGELIISYDEVRDAIVAHRRWEPVVGFGGLILGFVAAGRLAVLTQPLWMPDPPPVRDKVVKFKKKKKRVKTRLKELEED